MHDHDICVAQVLDFIFSQNEKSVTVLVLFEHAYKYVYKFLLGKIWEKL